MAVGDLVVAGDADHEAAALVAVELDLQQCRPKVVLYVFLETHACMRRVAWRGVTEKQLAVRSSLLRLWKRRVQLVDVCGGHTVIEHVGQDGREGCFYHKDALVGQVEEPAALVVDGEAAREVRIQRHGPAESLLEGLVGRRRRRVSEHDRHEDVEGGALSKTVSGTLSPASGCGVE